MSTAPSATRPVVDPALQLIIDQALALEPPPAPAAMPAPGQSRSAWEAEVAALRAAHVVFGRDHRERMSDGVPPAPAPEVAEVRDIAVPVGGASVRIRHYTPLGLAPFPALVMFHGGGFWLGGEDAGMDDADAGCRMLCAQLGAVVVNVDYRQSPEHKFPGPLEDCYAATEWIAAHSAELQVDAGRLSICGASAGGNLTAGVARLARDRSGPDVRLQVLLVPTTDATMATSSTSAMSQGFELTEEGVAEAWAQYLHPDTDRRDPLVSPLLAEDLHGLPPAHVIVAELDPLHDEGVAYARRLQEAGVPTTLSVFHMTHSLMTPDVLVAYLTDLIGAIRRANDHGA